MPLIILCGYPCSGKSLVASLLATALRNKLSPDRLVVVVTEPVVSSGEEDPRCSIFGDSVKERELRALHKSEVERALTAVNNERCSTDSRSPVVVIMDSGNQIKGSRYELYCLAKSVKQSHAVVFCDTPVDLVHKWNTKIGRYPTHLLNSIIDCFETPQPNQRWDHPLFVFRAEEQVNPEQIDISALACDVYNKLLAGGRNVVKPNRSTELASVTPTYVLQELERIAQTTSEHIMTQQSMGQMYVDVPPGLSTKVECSEDTSSIRLQLQGRQKPFTLAELARDKRRFITLQRAHLGELVKKSLEPSAISAAFLRFIATSQ